MSQPVIGMIVPPAAGEVPPEPPILYPDLTFIARGLALPRLTPEGYASVIDRCAELAVELKAEGAEAVALMGTSLSFFRGPEGNARVLDAMRAVTGLPVTTMTDAIIAALKAVGARRLAVGTAYIGSVNDALRDYLTGAGFEILSLEAMNLTEVADIQSVGEAELLDLGRRAATSAPAAEALFVSCGGLRTLPVTVPLENDLGLPVITSATAAAWGAVRLIGHTGSVPGWGRLFAETYDLTST